MKNLVWKEVKEDLDYEDSCENFQKWESEETIVSDGALRFNVVFTITKRNKMPFMLFMGIRLEDNCFSLSNERKGFSTFEEANDVAKNVFESFISQISEKIEQIKE